MSNQDTDSDFYNERKYCDHCDKYVSYLMSTDCSFCVECGNKVHLFSKNDWEEFNTNLKERRPKGGRSRKAKGNDKRDTA